MEIQSVSHYLQSTLNEIQKRNPSYSMRSFANKIEISPGGLNHILTGRKKISLDRAYQVAQNLTLDSTEKEYFLSIATYEQAKLSERKKEISQQIYDLIKRSERITPTQFEIDNFKLISNWYGFAVLECISSYGRNYSISNISDEFQISIEDVSETLDRLIRLELVTFENNQWLRTEKRLWVESDTPSTVIRNYYKDISEKSLIAIDEQTPSEKIIATETFSFHPDSLQNVKELTDKYLDDLIELCPDKSNNTKTYQAFVNIFDLGK